jgi:hypothetical protein
MNFKSPIKSKPSMKFKEVLLVQFVGDKPAELWAKYWIPVNDESMPHKEWLLPWRVHDYEIEQAIDLEQNYLPVEVTSDVLKFGKKKIELVQSEVNADPTALLKLTVITDPGSRILQVDQSKFISLVDFLKMMDPEMENLCRAATSYKPTQLGEMTSGADITTLYDLVRKFSVNCLWPS